MAQLPQQDPWAFQATYAQPLPAPISFNPHADFLNLVDWAAALAPPALPPRVLPVLVIATYASAKDKASEVNSASTVAEQIAAQAGVTRSVALAKWPARTPVVGVVTSSLSHAAQHQAGQNDWHTVAMAREGDTVWVHDPDYRLSNGYASSAPGYRRRVASVPGTRMVKALIDQMPSVSGVWFQGPPATFSQGQLQCMGRSALWVEHTLQGTAPWPPNTPGTGGTWTFHHKN
jgi:hypothetical protein